jgi:hypothetical protein
MKQLTLWLEEPHVSPSALLDCEKDSETTGETLHSSIARFFRDSNPDGSFGKTFPEFIPLGQVTRQVRWESKQDQDGKWMWSKRVISHQSLERFQNSGMAVHGEFLTLNTLEFPNDAVESSLLDVLETGEVPQRFFLSPVACQGILRRAAKRNRTLPPSLQQALEHAVQTTTKDRQDI